jgi:hypothetical protein
MYAEVTKLIKLKLLYKLSVSVRLFTILNMFVILQHIIETGIVDIYCAFVEQL